jgi:biopolymer transport protein ExbD
MPLLKRRAKDNPEIPSSSMADIAFLLLIFFLVTTTINADKGIYMQLPPKADPNNPPPEINQRNLLNVLVSDDGSVLLDGEVTSISQIREAVVRHVRNNGQDPELSVSPDKAVVSFKTRRGLPYEKYIDVLDEIRSAYTDIRNAAAQTEFGTDYGTYRTRLGEDDVDEIAERYPIKISLAEPDPG